MSSSLQPRGLQHARLPCPSPTPRACSNSCPSSRWCHPTISSSVFPFSSWLQSFPESGKLKKKKHPSPMLLWTLLSHSLIIPSLALMVSLLKLIHWLKVSWVPGQGTSQPQHLNQCPVIRGRWSIVLVEWMNFTYSQHSVHAVLPTQESFPTAFMKGARGFHPQVVTGLGTQGPDIFLLFWLPGSLL